MKKIISKIFVLIAMMLSSCAESQNNNLLTFEEYTSISINGVTLNIINQTKGEYTSLENLFSFDFEYYSIDIPDNYRGFSSLDLDVEFLYNPPYQSNYEISGIKVKSTDIVVNILGTNIKIGDSIDLFDSSTVKKESSIVYEIGSSNSSQEFLKHVNFLVIKFDKNTNVITEIEFVVLT